jgi:hypothetical protein
MSCVPTSRRAARAQSLHPERLTITRRSRKCAKGDTRVVSRRDRRASRHRQQRRTNATLRERTPGSPFTPFGRYFERVIASDSGLMPDSARQCARRRHTRSLPPRNIGKPETSKKASAAPGLGCTFARPLLKSLCAGRTSQARAWFTSGIWSTRASSAQGLRRGD